MVDSSKQAKEDKRIKEEMLRRQEQHDQRIKEARDSLQKNIHRKKEATETEQAAYKKTIHRNALKKQALLKKKRKKLLIMTIVAILASGGLIWLFGMIRTMQ